MTDPRFARLMELVDAALACAPADADGLLRRECAGDEVLLEEARSLVRLGRNDSGEAITGLLARQVAAAAGETIPEPERLGDFRIVERLGEGGMGAVYLARQDGPIRRDVAVKVVRTGLADGRAIARFEAERQALASLDHPGIARIFDAGATPDGTPFFAMEYVRGEPITRYCDRHRLTVEERLKLFVQVCRAIQHAHFQGIIHRDIKPSNVLVTTVDGEPTAKVIDFGIAKLTQDLTANDDGHTQPGAMMGTPEYMSPEQAEGAEVIDTRTDVYSLGVLLYELVSGGLPFQRDTLRGLAPAALRALLTGTDPDPPSKRLSLLADSADVAARRSCAPKALHRQLRNDLDWVIMKALEREPERRYASPLDLAADTERILDHEPVLASAPTVFTRVAKFYRRHRLAVSAAALLLVAIVTGATASTVGFLRAAEERRVARQEAAVATSTSRFLTESLAAARPAEVDGGETTVREILDLAAARLTRETDLMPEVEARLRYTLGAGYAALADDAAAMRHLFQARALSRQLGAASTEQAAQALTTLADVFDRRDQPFMARLVQQQLLDVYESLTGPDSFEYAATLVGMGQHSADLQDLTTARRLLQRARAALERIEPAARRHQLGASIRDLAARLDDPHTAD